MRRDGGNPLASRPPDPTGQSAGWPASPRATPHRGARWRPPDAACARSSVGLGSAGGVVLEQPGSRAIKVVLRHQHLEHAHRGGAALGVAEERRASELEPGDLGLERRVVHAGGHAPRLGEVGQRGLPPADHARDLGARATPATPARADRASRCAPPQSTARRASWTTAIEQRVAARGSGSSRRREYPSWISVASSSCSMTAMASIG